MFCSKCGTQVAADAKVCPQCGEVLGGPVVTPPAPAWVAPTVVRAQTGRWISAGWNMVTADLGSFSVLTLLFVVINSVGSIVTQGPLQTGAHIFCMKKLFRKRAELGDLFRGFDFFLPSFVATLLIAIFVFGASLLCLIPGLVVASMYKFTYLFILDKRMDFWPAMQASHAVVRNDYFGFTMFLIAMALINVLGFLCFIVGLLVTIPLSIAAITVAYSEIVGFDQRTVDAF